jgi:L-fuconate dehydratase
MIDANQIWEVDQAIDWVSELASFDLWFVEEPTCPDDVFGHKKIRDKLRGIRVATGEHCQNRVMFKQFISTDAIDVVQIDSCRLCSINEILSVYVLAAKYGKPVCPHAGGIGLCEYVQHLSMIDYVRISASLTDRVIEYVEYLHEHFEDPCIIRNGSYMPPMSPGFSIKMFPESIEHYTFPTGKAWAEN